MLCCSALLPAITSMPALSQTLPAPPTADNADTVQTLYLEIVLNQYPTQRVIAVIQKDDSLLIKRELLIDIGLPAERLAGREEVINLSRLSDVEVQYHSPTQRLYINVPPHWLSRQYHASARTNSRYPLQASPGALFNYDAYVSSARRGGTTASLGHEARLFGTTGTFTTTGIYRQALTGESGMNEGYRRFDTRWEYADQETMVHYTAGDVITRPLGWTNAVRLGGIQISRDFALRPDLVTYPLPEFSGETAVPTTLDLFIDGTRQSSTALAPGPFTLTNMPMVTGAGEAIIVTTDSQGRRVSTNLPFYISSELLSPGLTSYSASVGALRKDFGQRDFAYRNIAATGSYRRGINDYFTLELQAEAASDVSTAGAGGAFKLWRLGTLESAYRQSYSEGITGASYTTGYRYRSRGFNIGLRHQVEQAEFVDLANSIQRNSNYRAQREISQLTTGLSLGRLGSLAGGYFDIKTDQDSRSRLLNLTYSRPLWERMHLSLSANREVGGDWSALAQVTLPLSRRPGTLSASVRRDAEGGMSTRTQYTQTAPIQGGWGWNLAYEQRSSENDYRQAELAWRGAATELRGGTFGTQQNAVHYADARGSLVRMDSQWFAANYVRDGFVVVSTDGQPGVPVRYENQLVGSTRDSGHLLVPWARAYYAGKYEIDPLVLPANLSVAHVEQRVAVNARSGYLLNFPVKRVIAATLVLVDSQGDPLPLGSRVITNSGAVSLIGWDGQTYLENLESANQLHVTLPSGDSCELRLAIDVLSDEIHHLGSQLCR
ncbi:fimbria/pilus outer membrane usher protein [Halomonas sp. AOP12-C2-37]|uniref:fimbria/pilus outer membrane usher protein n=1 Tax=unclassified Halomonas TaxID=2609666 RepID=UPI00403415F0